jgi:periplasmic protein CpxP/Spy
MRLLRVAMFVCAFGLVASVAVAQDTSTPAPPPDTAQGPPPGGGRGMMDPARRTEMLRNQLGLNDTQTAQVKAILEDERTKMEALRADTSSSMQEKRPKMMAIRQDEEAKIEAILTPDQKAKFEAMRQRRPGGGPPPNGDGTAPPPPPQQ